jgi:hypothetical protein
MKAFDRFNPDAVRPLLSEISSYLPGFQEESINNHLKQFDFQGAKMEMCNLAKALGMEDWGER